MLDVIVLGGGHAGVEAALAAEMDVLAVGYASNNEKATYRAESLNDKNIWGYLK